MRRRLRIFVSKMADSSRERDSLFKKCVGKLSEKYHRSFLLDLASIYLGLKPSLLFDYTVVDATNARTFRHTVTQSCTGLDHVVHVLDLWDLYRLLHHLRASDMHSVGSS